MKSTTSYPQEFALLNNQCKVTHYFGRGGPGDGQMPSQHHNSPAKVYSMSNVSVISLYSSLLSSTRCLKSISSHFSSPFLFTGTWECAPEPSEGGHVSRREGQRRPEKARERSHDHIHRVIRREPLQKRDRSKMYALLRCLIHLFVLVDGMRKIRTRDERPCSSAPSKDQDDQNIPRSLE